MKVLITVALLVATAAALPKIPRPPNRITNGNFAKQGEFPHQVGLHLFYKNEAEKWCGGVFISNQWILTAAQCTDAAVKADVLVGYTKLTSTNITEPNRRIISISKKHIYIPDGWSSKNRTDDISLIKLPRIIEFNEDVKKIDLPSKDEYNTYVNSLAVASGWGKTSDSERFISTDLHYLEGPVINNVLCQQYYKYIQPTHICLATTNTHISTCKGDSGGPLVSFGTNKLIGITSFVNPDGCELGYPSVFTRVSSYLDWIESVSGVK